MTFIAAGLTVLAVILTFGTGATTGQIHSSDAAGNAMAEAFGSLLAVVLWILLGVLLLMCGFRDGFPNYSGAAMAAAFVLALVARVMAAEILKAETVQGAPATLLPLMTVVGPLLVIARAAWGIFPPLRASVPEAAGSWAPIVLLVLVSLTPFPFRPQYAKQQEAAQASAAAIQAEGQRQRDAQEAQRVQETLGKIAELTPQSDLFSGLVFCADKDPDVRDAARAKVRTFVNRQADAEELLAEGLEPVLRELPNFALSATAPVCEHAKKILASKASVKPFDNDPIRIEDAEREIGTYADAARWLVGNGCDCRSEIAGMQQAVERFANSPRKQKLLADLAAANPGR